ncbi:MAG: Gfo/Idh/MocA family oxidoreductase [Thermogutta sp.]
MPTNQSNHAIPVGVIGAGRLGTFHARKLAAMPDVTLIGVADPVADRRQPLADECRCQAVSEYRQLLPHCAAVVIAVPTSLHYATAMECIKAGVHVFVEKPMTETSEQAHRLLETAQERNLVIQVGHIERFNPAFRAIPSSLSDIQLIEASRCGPFSFRITDVGVVMDLMIHDLDLILTLVKQPVRQIDAIGLSILGTHEDLAIARVEFEHGAVALLKASRIEREPTRTMRIWHRKGQVLLDFAQRTASVCEYPVEVQSGSFRIEELSSHELAALKATFPDRFFPWQTPEIEACDPLEAELRDFIRAVQGGSRPLVTGEDGLAAVQLAEDILDRIRKGAFAPHPQIAPLQRLPKAA